MDVALQADPYADKALAMFENMTNKHSRDLAVSELVWDKVVDDDILLLALPRLVLTFKYPTH